MHLDAFAHHGLGGSGLAVLAALAERGGQSLTELRASASISRPTAYRQFGKLKSLGLIHHGGELYHHSPTAGAGEQRRPHHEAQRIHWRNEQVRLVEPLDRYPCPTLL